MKIGSRVAWSRHMQDRRAGMRDGWSGGARDPLDNSYQDDPTQFRRTRIVGICTTPLTFTPGPHLSLTGVQEWCIARAWFEKLQTSSQKVLKHDAIAPEKTSQGLDLRTLTDCHAIESHEGVRAVPTQRCAGGICSGEKIGWTKCR